MKIGENFNPDDILKNINEKDFSNVEMQIQETDRKLGELTKQLKGVIKELIDMGYDPTDPRADEAVLPFLTKDPLQKTRQDTDTENYYHSLIEEKKALEEEIKDLKKDRDGLIEEL